MNKERIKEVFSDQEFIKELVSLEAAEDIQALLKTKGFELDLEQIEKAKALVAEKLAQFEAGENVLDEELDEDDLDTVSGGVVTLTYVLVKVVVVGICVGVAQVHQTTKGRW